MPPYQVGHLLDLGVLKEHVYDGCYTNYLHMSVLLGTKRLAFDNFIFFILVFTS